MFSRRFCARHHPRLAALDIINGGLQSAIVPFISELVGVGKSRMILCAPIL